MKNIYLILILLSLISCEIKTEDFSFQRIEFTGNEFRTDGYYYQKSSGGSYNVLFFYKNGLSLGSGILGGNVEELNGNILNANWDKIKEVPIGIGVFKVEGDVVDYEFWANPESGCYIPVAFSGEILSNENLSFEREGHDNMIFEQNSFKPDSTNQWID